MPPATSSSKAATPEPTSPATPISPAPTSTTQIKSATLKAADAGVKKLKQKTKRHTKRQTARLNMQMMHAFFKAHRDEDKYKDIPFQELQKVLGKLWKASPENPKNIST